MHAVRDGDGYRIPLFIINLCHHFCYYLKSHTHTCTNMACPKWLSNPIFYYNRENSMGSALILINWDLLQAIFGRVMPPGTQMCGRVRYWVAYDVMSSVRERNLTFSLLDPDQIRKTLCYTLLHRSCWDRISRIMR